MLSVVLIGSGNVAQHLFKAFSDTPIRIVQVFGRNQETLKWFSTQVRTSHLASEIVEADVYLIAVNDGSIKEVSKLLMGKNGLVAHTSGSISIDALEPKRKGVFYPLQTFSGASGLVFKKIPICIEATHDKDLEVLKSLAAQVSESVHEISSAQRGRLHLAAVFANNFTNHLYQIAHNLCSDENVSFELLAPLIRETANKIRLLTPEEAQTGPAVRNDTLTMQQHLEALKNPIHKKIYRVLSESIINSHEEKL